jgi:thiol-disulfide isomerase/thioredoxin
MKFFFISIFLILTTISSSSYSKEEKGIINSFLKEELEDFELSKEKQNISDLKFKDNEGKEISFSDFQDKVLLVNFWATWCAPCIKEMPSLDRLKKKINKNFDVIAISVDRDGVKKVKNFFNEHKITNLGKYFDIKNSLAKEMNLIGLPTSFFINKKGDLIGYFKGDMEWDNDTVIEFINYLIKT